MGLMDWYSRKEEKITFEGGLWGYLKCWFGYHNVERETVYESENIKSVNESCRCCGKAWGFTHIDLGEFRIG